MLFIKDEYKEGGEDEGFGKDEVGEFLGDFFFVCVGVDEVYDVEGVEGGEEVKDFEEVVLGVGFDEEVCVVGYEDESVEELGKEGDVWDIKRVRDGWERGGKGEGEEN